MLAAVGATVAAFAGAAAAPPAGLTAYVGGAGCDGNDTSCVPPASVPDIRGVSFSGDKLAVVGKTDSGSMPAWITAASGAAPEFVYATLTGNATAIAYHTMAGALTYISAGKTNGTAPVHSSIDRSGKWLVVANYGGCDNCTGPDGAVSVLPIATDGSIGDAVFTITHHGHGVNPLRQGCAHVHSAVASRTMDIVYVQDLGLDKVFVYAIDTKTGALKYVDSVNSSKPGAGPRHLVLHPTKPMAYVVEEMASTVSVYAVRATGALAYRQSYPSTPVAGGKAAEIVISPDGSLLFVSNRGMCAGCDSVQVFHVGSDGLLTAAGDPVDPQAHYPRGMELTPDGKILMVAGQGDGHLSSFDVASDGTLKLRDTLSGLGTPATIAFAQ